MAFSKTQIIILSAVGFIVFLSALVFFGILPGLRSREPEITFSFWGVADEESVFETMLQEYKKIAPRTTVEYRKFSPVNYEGILIDALAAGEGPDIFMFHSSWLEKHGNKVAPFPKELIDIPKLRELFPQVVEQDFVSENKIYALPLSIDTLALYHNRDIFDRRAVALPPQTWQEFRNIAFNKKVNTDFGGDSSTASQAKDVISLLMLQAGAKMTTDDFKKASFANEAGLRALNFYSQFNPSARNSLEGFSAGEIGMLFEYQAAKDSLASRNPFLNFTVTATPQFDKDSPVNFASYYGLAVAKKSNMPSVKKTKAWELAAFLATNEAVAENYLKASSRPPALRSLIKKYLDHPELGVFARQALTARSWKQPDPDAVTAIFDNMIKSVKSKTLSPSDALRQAENQVSALLSR